MKFQPLGIFDKPYPKDRVELEERWKNCTRCYQLSEYRKGPPVMGFGPDGADVFVVGQWPGVGEEVIGVPFSKDIGLKCMEAFSRNGISKESVYWSNVLACPVKEGSTSFSVKFTSYEGGCGKRLDDELFLVRPLTVVALGSVAMGRFDIKGTVEECRAGNGKVFMYASFPLYVVMHPAAYWRATTEQSKADIVRKVREDLAALKKAIEDLKAKI